MAQDVCISGVEVLNVSYMIPLSLGLQQISDQRGRTRISIVVRLLPAQAANGSLDVIAYAAIAIEAYEILRDELVGRTVGLVKAIGQLNRDLGLLRRSLADNLCRAANGERLSEPEHLAPQRVSSGPSPESFYRLYI